MISKRPGDCCIGLVNLVYDGQNLPTGRFWSVIPAGTVKFLELALSLHRQDFKLRIIKTPLNRGVHPLPLSDGPVQAAFFPAFLQGHHFFL